jgi:aminoglycoside phosphotransferase (APT) family kinase protein
MPKDVYLQPNVPDPVLDFELVLSLARRHAPNAQAVTAVDESGGEARTYAIDSNLIFKTQRPHRLRPRTSLAREVFFLNQIAAVAPDLAVPRVVGYGRADEYIEYTLMTRMPGIALRNANLDRVARLQVMRELGRTLRHIHQMPQAEFVSSDLFPSDQSSGDTRARVNELIDDLAARIQNEKREWSLQVSPIQIAERVKTLLPPSDERVALHSNPYHEHTFVDPATGEFSGLIDFGDAYISHPTFDLRRWRTREEREQLLAGYCAEQAVSEEFLRMWLALQVVGDLAAIASSPLLGPAAHADLEWLLTQF